MNTSSKCICPSKLVHLCILVSVDGYLCMFMSDHRTQFLHRNNCVLPHLYGSYLDNLIIITWATPVGFMGPPSKLKKQKKHV